MKKQKPPAYVLVRGIFLDKKFRIAPPVPIESMHSEADYLDILHPEDAVLLNMEDGYDRHKFDALLKVLHQEYHADKTRLSRLRKTLTESNYHPRDFELELQSAHSFGQEALLGITMQTVSFGAQKTSFGHGWLGKTALGRLDIESMLVDLGELVKAHKKKKASFLRSAKRKASAAGRMREK